MIEARRALLEFDHRLEGVDTYLSGTLDVAGSNQSIPVQVLTFGQVTLLRPIEPLSLGLEARTWHRAKLVLADLSGRHRIPADLETALRTAGYAPDQMPESERRYVVNFVAEAHDPGIRCARIELALAALKLVHDADTKGAAHG